MHRFKVAVVFSVVLATAVALAGGAHAGGSSPAWAGLRSGVIPTRGQALALTNNLLYHGGPVMTNGAAVTPIFWGSSWNSDFQGKKSWMGTFYRGMSGSRYARTNGEYTQSGGRHVSTSISVSSAITDLSAAPRGAPSTSAVLAEVSKVITHPVSNGYHPVYVDARRGSAGYCAWHSAGTIRGTSVQFAFFFNLDGDRGCDPRSSSSAYSQGVAALANVSGHELSEALTDPHLNAWYDASGEENADKCAWTFGHPLLTFSNGSRWKVQGNYSNAAAAARSGYNGGGCIDGG